MNCYVLGSSRIPFTKSFTNYAGVSTQELMTASLNGLVEQCRLQGEELGDVALGAVMKSSNDWNLARECVLGTKLHANTPGYDTQRACGTSLENALQIQLKISAGRIVSGIAGGVDSNSDIPFLFPKSFAKKLMRLNSEKSALKKAAQIFSFGVGDFKPVIPAVVEPRTHLSMGQHCELMVKEWHIDRKSQDEFALQSHKNADKAYQAGFYSDLVVEFAGLRKDTFVRADTTIEKMGKLKPAFDPSEKGTLTAANSSPLTDGSACVLLGNEDFARKKNLKPWARIVDGEVAALDFVKGEGLLMAPTVAVGRLLHRNRLKLQDFDYYELHEAFAGQVLCTLKAWENDQYCRTHFGEQALGPVDRSKVNVVGSSLALGHPFAATGARIVGTLAKLLSQSSSKKRGLISICTAGGMGVAAILETA